MNNLWDKIMNLHKILLMSVLIQIQKIIVYIPLKTNIYFFTIKFKTLWKQKKY